MVPCKLPSGHYLMRVLGIACLLAVLALPRGVAARSGSDAAGLRDPTLPAGRSWDEKQHHGLQAARLSVTVASLNVFLLSVGGSLWLSAASDQDTRGVRRASYAIGTIQVAGAISNLVWLVYAGETLRDYKQRTGNWMRLRTARLHTALTGIDTSFRLAGVAGGITALVRNRRYEGKLSRMTGYFFLIPNLAVLPFHIWALVASGSELRHRKRESVSTRARRLEPIASGFRF